MAVKTMERERIIMNFSVAPSAEDIEVMALGALESLPEQLMELCEGLAVKVEDFPDDATQHDLELEGPYDLLALYKSGSQIAPGVIKKTANDDDILFVYRRPLLDAWCESGEDIGILLRQVMIEEIAANFDFAEDDIEEMIARHLQGMV